MSLPVTSDNSWRPPRPGNPIVYGWGEGGHGLAGTAHQCGETVTTLTRMPRLSGFMADVESWEPGGRTAVIAAAADTSPAFVASCDSTVVTEPEAQPDVGPAVSQADRFFPTPPNAFYFSPTLHGMMESVGVRMSIPYSESATDNSLRTLGLDGSMSTADARGADRIAARIVELSNDALAPDAAEAARISHLECALRLLTSTDHSYLPGVFNVVIRACLAHKRLRDARLTYAMARDAGVAVADPLVAQLIGYAAPQLSQASFSAEDFGSAAVLTVPV